MYRESHTVKRQSRRNRRLKEDMTMKTKVISYWVTTIFTSLELLAGGVTDLMHGRTALVAGEPVAEVLAHLDYPVYLLTILGVWKLLGGITWASPSVSSEEANGPMPAFSLPFQCCLDLREWNDLLKRIKGHLLAEIVLQPKLT